MKIKTTAAGTEYVLEPGELRCLRGARDTLEKLAWHLRAIGFGDDCLSSFRTIDAVLFGDVLKPPVESGADE
jgi:hypothetical protein